MINRLLTVVVSIFLAASVTDYSVAQTTDVPSKSETRLITLGTVAGPPPRAHRAQSSNLLIVNGTLYVVDAGDGAARRITKAGFNVRDVGTIFITHHQGADLLVSEANSIEQRMQDLIRSGQWQVMTPEEQVRIKGQMAEGHLSTEDVGKMAARAGVKTVVLTHLTWKADDDYSTWADEVKKHFSGPVLIAKDLKEF
jgi:ribonuclease BN (tRNA processing enzyme)